MFGLGGGPTLSFPNNWGKGAGLDNTNAQQAVVAGPSRPGKP